MSSITKAERTELRDIETLRRAAALMRERAEAATPGERHIPRRGSGIDAGEYDTVIGPGRVECMAYCCGGSSTIEGDNLDADAEHIASWHPAVALAVADWLDGVALHLEARADEEWYDLDGDPISPEDTHAIGSALAVARAYLADPHARSDRDRAEEAGR